MKILLLGYGKMGKTLHKLSNDHGHEVVAADNSNERDELGELKFDVAIEFSQPDAAFDNIIFCLQNGIPVVSGTTGWLDKKSDVEKFCQEKNGTFFYASNFSIGVNLFFKLNKWMARLMNNHQDYNIEMEEIHHTEKKDSPSGTAITIAEGIIQNLDFVNEWVENKKQPGSLSLLSKREGDVPGTHTVKYYSEMDEISLTHKAYTRESFARGALLVAEWVNDKQGILTMEDFMKE